MMTTIPEEIRVGVTRFQAGVDTTTVQGAINRMQRRLEKMETALRFGVQLCETGGHDGKNDRCPNCHFLNSAREAL